VDSCLANDTLINGAVPTPLDVSVDIDPVTSGNQPILIVSGEGIWAYDGVTGILGFTPEPGFNDGPTPITYTLTDSANRVSDPATVTVDYSAVPPGPTATDDMSDPATVTVNYAVLIASDDISNLNVPGTLVFVPILSNDVSSVGGPIAPFLVTVDVDASLPGVQPSRVVPGEGTWTFDGFLMLFFNPEIGFTGDPTPIIYTLTETLTAQSDQATVTVQYLAPPVALPRDILITTPAVDFKMSLDGQNGHPAPLSGTDVQDGNMSTGHTFMVTNISGLNGNTLLYNTSPLRPCPSLLQTMTRLCLQLNSPVLEVLPWFSTIW
jgi:hypothetical protein